MQKIKLLLLSLLIPLAACTPKVVTGYQGVTPEGLKDCSYYRFQETSGNSVQGWKCPDSDTTTSYKSGKSTQYMIFLSSN